MNTVDIIILICMVPFIISGFRKGFIDQAVGLLSLILGLILSFRFYKYVAMWMATYTTIHTTTAQVISFVIVMCAVVILLNIIGALLEKLLKAINLGFLDKVLGFVFAILKGVLVIGVLIVLFNALNTNLHLVSEETLNSSALYPPIKNFTTFLFPKLKEIFLTTGSVITNSVA